MCKTAKFEVVEFEVEDVIVTSGDGSADQEGGIDDEVPSFDDSGK